MIKNTFITTTIVFGYLYGGIPGNASLKHMGFTDDKPILKNERNICGSPNSSLEKEQAVNRYMEKNHPELYKKMKMPLIRQKAYTIGEIDLFYVLQSDEQGNSVRNQIGAKLLAKGDHVAIWADTTILHSANTISDALAEQYKSLLETKTPIGSIDTTKGVWDIELEYFGNPPDKDGDGIVDFLFADLYSGVAGYFSPWDQTNYEGSNQRDIVYIDIGSTISYTEATLSHEFQHLIHYTYDPDEDTQFNEGLSEMATILCGGEYISHAYYLQDPSISWKWESDIQHYAMASLFTLYYVEQFGVEVIKDVMTNTSNGFTAFNTILSNKNTGLDHKGFLKNWYIANYLDDITVDRKYGYESFIPMRAKPQFTFRLANQNVPNNSILKLSPNYIEYSSSADSMEMTLTAQNSTRPEYAVIEYTNNSISVKDIVDGATHLVDHDTEKVAKAVFIVANTKNTASVYDFVSKGYDISEYSEYDEIAYDDGTPDVFSYDGGSFGWLGWGGGESNVGKGWAMHFKPAMAQNQLVEFKVMAGFEQEFSGSTTPLDAEKDFEIHVWKPIGTDGTVEDVITPFIFSPTVSSITSSEFLVVDLSPYAEQLKDLQEVFVGFVEDDSIGTYLAMDRNADGKTYTYAFNYGGEKEMASLSDFNVSGSSLDGWNYMMRATFFYSDTTKPVFTSGFFQNPVFTDELDLYALGSSLMAPNKIKITATNGGESKEVVSQILPGNDSILVAHNYRLKSSGTLDINLKGKLRYGQTELDTSFSYNVTYTEGRVGATLFADNYNFRMDIPGNALSEDIFILSGKGNLNKLDNAPNTNLPLTSSEIYTVSPVGKALNLVAPVTIEIPSKLSDQIPQLLVVGFWDGNSWRELPTRVSPNGNSLVGIAKTLGHFVIMKAGSGQPLAVENTLLPKEFALRQNYPNPFNPETSIQFELPQDGWITLTIYDILGQSVSILKNGYYPAGYYQVSWDGHNRWGAPVGSGVYFYQLSAGSFRHTKKMILTR